MEKAWDFKGLQQELVSQGLPMLEEGVEKILSSVYNWVNKSIELEPNPIVKALAKPAADALLGPDGYVMSMANKIDGQEG